MLAVSVLRESFRPYCGRADSPTLWYPEGPKRAAIPPEAGVPPRGWIVLRFRIVVLSSA